ncbi:unnamed protein product [Closterium sp. NIES-65]|nr:unnamed protein product [Closterium sp. NIES-65]
MTQRPPPQQSKASRLPSVAAAMLPQKPPRLRRRRASPSLPCPQSSILLSLHHYLTLLLLSLTVFSFLTPSLGRHVIVGQRHIDGFNYPWNPVVNYTQWAATFPVIAGDTLVFQYESGEEVVYEVPSQGDLDDCRLDDARLLCDSLDGEGGRSSDRGGHVRGCRVLVESRTLYLTSKVDHCRAGQRVVIRPRESVFKYPAFQEEVVQFSTLADFKSCNFRAAKIICYDSWGAGANGCAIRVTAVPGMYASGLYGHCKAGQKLVVKASARPYSPRTLVVGYMSEQFAWQWNPEAQLVKWANANKVYVGDTLVFKYPPYKDEVYIVPTLRDYNNCVYTNYVSYCNGTDGGGQGCFTNPITSTTYFVSGLYSHCKAANQKIIITPLKPPS